MGKLGYSSGWRLGLSKAHCMLVLSSVEKQKPNQLKKKKLRRPRPISRLQGFWEQLFPGLLLVTLRTLKLGSSSTIDLSTLGSFQLSNKLRIQLLTRTLASRQDRNVGVRNEREPIWIIGYGADCGQPRRTALLNIKTLMCLQSLAA